MGIFIPPRTDEPAPPPPDPGDMERRIAEAAPLTDDEIRLCIEHDGMLDPTRVLVTLAAARSAPRCALGVYCSGHGFEHGAASESRASTESEGLEVAERERDALDRKSYDLEEWQRGAIGAATIAHPVRTGPHTEEAYVAHSTEYETGSESYREGADVVSAGVLAAKARLVERAEHAERDNATLRAEVERLRGLCGEAADHCAYAAMTGTVIRLGELAKRLRAAAEGSE